MTDADIELNKNGARKAACVGAGVIGSGWAATFALGGVEVGVHDPDPASLARAAERVSRSVDFMASRGLVSEASAASAKARVSYTADIAEAVADAGLVQESVPENYEAKRRAVALIEAAAPPDAIVATSTSGLLVSEIARDAAYPGRVVGAHPYNPPYLVPFVELMRGKESSEEAMERARAFYEGLGMETATLRKEAPGFIANRLQMALYREAIDLVERGVCSVEDVDKAAMYGIGFRYASMGPNLIFHLGAGDRGIRGLLASLRDSSAERLRDMARWTEEPASWPELAEAGVIEELAHRDPRDGRTIPELIEYRDDALIAILQHRKKA